MLFRTESGGAASSYHNISSVNGMHRKKLRQTTACARAGR
jgi:hypothetical protein